MKKDGMAALMAKHEMSKSEMAMDKKEVYGKTKKVKKVKKTKKAKGKKK